jgi:SAM-dependent methyltransferase
MEEPTDHQAQPGDGALRLYDEFAGWWPLLSAPDDYAEEAAFYGQTIMGAADGTPKTLLELGSGGGNNASHLKAYFSMTLVDVSPGMLEVSRALNPECEHHEGDMRSVQLDRMFDAVFVHDAVMYLTTEADLSSAIETAHAHCRPGGIALFVPDCVRETFRPYTKHGGHDGAGAAGVGRGLRYLEWVSDPDPSDTTYLCDFAYLLREGSAVRCEQDRHVMGIFPRQTWLDLLTKTGFRTEVIPCSQEASCGQEVEGPEYWEAFLGVRPGR